MKRFKLQEKINIDELYKQQKITEDLKLQIYNKILNRVHDKIKYTSRQRNNLKFCAYVIPEFILGTPKYNVELCTSYIMDKLIANGFNIRYTHPNLLFISWKHWIPSYKRAEIKKNMGSVIDGLGNIKKNVNNSTETKQITGGNSYDNLLFKQRDVKIEKKKETFKQTDNYKPTGNFIYSNDLINKMNDNIKL